MSKLDNRTLAGMTPVGAFAHETVTSAWTDQQRARDAAIRLTNQAIAQTRMGICFDRRN